MRNSLVFLLTFAVSVSGQTAAVPAAAPTVAQNDSTYAVLWAQSSAEARAAAYQTYRGATSQMLKALADQNWTAALEQANDYVKLPPAVILDLDETVLDNSPMQARLIREGKTYSPQEWERWVKEARAGVLPGAVDFLKAAHAHGVAVFYVTNRVCDPKNTDDPTVAVLRKWSISVRPERLHCRTDSGDKGYRRRLVAAGHRVLLLIGDDFNDFISVPQDQLNVAGRERLAEAHRTYWGERWFILSNPMYGSWERAAGADAKARFDTLRQ